ncbi:hypothetical protein [Ammonifex thiophilus]|uniref:hypothetical protein n=1 Tax=Ammonifex thiophilus TaxID=444093 RepID=UPI00106D2F0B|nr:hypothetical protein [Ammonifex thiophilus]
MTYCQEGRPVLVPSSSRLIAFIGLIGILSMDAGIATVILYRLAADRALPDLAGLNYFLLCQAGVFAPYAVNKFAEAVSGKAVGLQYPSREARARQAPGSPEERAGSLRG